jgi:N-methylhydantoinase A
MPFDVYSRALLRRGMTFAGPCLIEEDAATTVVDAGARVTVDRYGSLDISLGAE